jgi:hypothetical protein
VAAWQGMTWQRELFGPGLDAYDPYASVRSYRPAPPQAPAGLPPLAPLPPAAQPIVQRVQPPAPSRSDQATRLAQDIAYGHSDWERAGQAVMGSGKFEDASGLRRAGAVAGGVALGTLALASWIPGFNVFKPAQAARAARAFGQGAATGARAGKGIVRSGMDEARSLETKRVRQIAANKAQAAGPSSPAPGYSPSRAESILSDPRLRTPPPRLQGIPADGFDNSEPTRNFARSIFERQGFFKPAQIVDEPTAELLRADPNYIPLFRGIYDRDAARQIVTSYAIDMPSGPVHTMYGLNGTGSYWGGPSIASGYAGAGYSNPGVMVEAFLPKGAKILDPSLPSGKKIIDDFARSSYHDFGAYAAALGYDVISHMGVYTVLNRSVLIFGTKAIDVSNWVMPAIDVAASRNPDEIIFNLIRGMRTSGNLRTLDLTSRPDSAITGLPAGFPLGPPSSSGLPRPRPRPKPTNPPNDPYRPPRPPVRGWD